MENNQPPKPAFPLLVLLALASALGVAVAIALAGVAMLLAAPAYAGEGSLLLQRPAAVAAAPLLFAETESQEHGPIVRTGAVETVLVELEYQQVLRYDRARTGLRLLTLR